MWSLTGITQELFVKKLKTGGETRMGTVGIAKKGFRLHLRLIDIRHHRIDEFRFGRVVDHDHKSQIYDIRK